jgi:hypothetical protein
MEAGKICWADPAALSKAVENDDTRAGLVVLAPEGLFPAPAATGEQRRIEPARAHTVGQWAAAPICY